MITRLGIYRSPSTDPYDNLALESCLLETVEEGQCILYLWQNQHTVVIGRNQNPWKECAVALLQEEGGKLARRMSGGGAVYHDLGNLNFTFLVHQKDYDLQRQLRVICQAVSSLGIPAELSGRNDILVEGRKFSGNAFYKHNGRAYHHGTLLVDTDMARLGRYLTPSKAKLESKGVDSVRSRVVNLRQYRRDLTVPMLMEALELAFAQVYAAPVSLLPPVQTESLTRLKAMHESWDWNFGRDIPFTCTVSGCCSWGSLEVVMDVSEGCIRSCRVYTDAMDWELAQTLERRLTLCRYAPEDLAHALEDIPREMAKELLELILS